MSHETTVLEAMRATFGATPLANYSPEQDRDENGRWTATGAANVSREADEATKAVPKTGDRITLARAHEAAGSAHLRAAQAHTALGAKEKSDYHLKAHSIHVKQAAVIRANAAAAEEPSERSRSYWGTRRSLNTRPPFSR